MSIENVSSYIEDCLPNIEGFIYDNTVLNGIIMMSQSKNEIEIIPVTIVPSPFPVKLFHNVTKLQPDFHLLFNRMARDYNELYRILNKAMTTDDYLRNLWNIYEIVSAHSKSDSVFLSLVRNDYLIFLPDQWQPTTDNFSTIVQMPTLSLRQVEYNLMSAGLAGMAQRVIKFHELNLQLVGVDPIDIIEKIPDNFPSDGFARGLICAWQLYNNCKAAILFIISSSERNLFDQRILEQSVHKQNSSIIVIRKTFEQCLKCGRLEDDNSLWLENLEISVVYFRHGYAPEHFYCDKMWETKLMIEKSRAIKCPSIHQMLVNTKLVQQALCDFSLLKKYLPELVATQLRETFANQYLLTNSNIVLDALRFPNRYVLKPQREGGGNNFFDDDLVKKLKEIKDIEEKHQYVLMERIYPASFENYILKTDGSISKETIVSELGIYGVFLGTEKEVYENFQCGHILRSKSVNSNEGGMIVGLGYVDCPYFI